MKKSWFALSFITSIFMATTAFAIINTIVTQPRGWRAVPSAVDANNNAFIVTRPQRPGTTFYYSHPGYRCVRTVPSYEGIHVSNGVVYHSSTGDDEVHCYPITPVPLE